jgi:eukaryotic-like serine/threonine-protein kinase
MALTPGTKLGPYEIVGALGSGGMGEVYRAKDTRLNRTVAVKILPADICADSVAKQRFEREAKTISGLNHPNICVLHDVGSQEGTEYLVMEYVEGETLAKRLEKGPLPLDQAVKIAAQIAGALDNAHRHGVVHRDLKPGNVMLTPAGAKLLDFGLAKEVTPAVSAATQSAASPTAPVTEQGMIVGTFQYMSPEQVEGKELDGRSDIFSLGAMLWEMLTGMRAFEGKTQLSVASAILEREAASLCSVLPMTPANLEHAIRRCLAKDRDGRWQSARDLADELKWIGESGSQASSAPMGEERTKSAGWLRAFPWVLCGVLAAGLFGASILWHSGKNNPETSYFYAGLPFPVQAMAIAPNGHTVAVIGRRGTDRTNLIWLYEVGGREARNLPESEGASFPFWSPDGKSLGFFAAGKLKKLDIAGGPVQVICDAPSGRGGTWNKDGVILFTPSGQLFEGVYRVSSNGGKPIPATMPDTSRGENTYRWPTFLPDQRHFLFLAANISGQSEPNAIYAGALDSNEKKFVTKSTGNAVYVAPGYLLYFRERTMFAQRFDVNKLELSGAAIAVLTDVAYQPRVFHATYAANDSGLLVAQSGSGVSISRLVWYDRKGDELGDVGKPDVYANIALAPDGKTVALDKTDSASQNTDVWTYDLQRESLKRLTFDPAIDSDPMWSPDGRQVLFASSRGHLFRLFVKNADGTEEERALRVEDPGLVADLYPSSWSHDGKNIIYAHNTELWVASWPELKARPFLKGPATVKNGQFSPDGKWVAYASNESGNWEIYVTAFPEARGKWQVSSAGGTQPRWRGDTTEMFYLAPDGKMMAVPVKAGANFDAGAPVALFQAHARELVATSEQVTYDVTKDGQRILINTQVKNTEMQPMSVILNWDAQLNEK